MNICTNSDPKLTCMCSFVNLEVLAPGEYFATAREGAGVRFLPRVDSDMIDQLVLGLEWFLFPFTVFPVADMVAGLRSPDVVHGDMSH